MLTDDMLPLILLLTLSVGWSTATAESSVPRGVPLSRLSFYDPSRDFVCLDGSESMPFSLVNDDYCDCTDGSDEPGTAACANGLFYCTNKGHKPMDLLSSRVNDGICDCCDGTDEYDGTVKCPNSCTELGRQAKEELRVKLQKQETGYAKKQQLVSDAGEKRRELLEKLAKLKADLGMVTVEVTELEEAKDTAEAPEKIAKEEQERIWREEKEAMEAAKNEAEAKAGFKRLDSNGDNRVTLEELQTFSELDDNDDTVVSREEAIEYLGGEDPVDFDTFYSMAWGKLKEKINFKEPQEDAKDEDAGYENGDVKEIIDDDDDDDDYDDDDDDDEGNSHDDKKIYDEATQVLIDVADKARDAVKQARNKKQDLERDISGTEKILGIDFGKDREFMLLYQECFEYTDREYTYKLCLFEKSSQRKKSGGSETSLGTWGKWDGPPDDLYSRMKYENGEKCWNGPARSTTVKMNCGEESKVISVMEPNRCEYQMEFVTPAVCQPVDHSLYHEEL